MKRILVLAFVCLLAACNRQRNNPKPENFVLITMDTTRADHLGCYGSTIGTTPRLDSLAGQGARFEQAVALVPLTRPSHATILTGLLPHHHNIWSNGPYRLEPQWKTLAQRFHEAGFQ